MEAYADVAEQIADTIYPPPANSPPSSTRTTAGPNDMVLSFSAGKVVDDALLLVSRGHEIFRSCSWPSRMEIMSPGLTGLPSQPSTSQHGRPTEVGNPCTRELTASDRSRADIFRLLKVMDGPSTEPTTITFEADLYEGQTLLFRWMNADMAHDFSKFAKHMREWFEKDKRWLAAWQRTVFPNGDFSKIRTRLFEVGGWEYLPKR